MDKNELINKTTANWISIADRDLLTARQGLEAKEVLTDTISFHCQQAAEKYLKAFLVKQQVEFNKTHSIAVLVNLCATIDSEFKEYLKDADILQIMPWRFAILTTGMNQHQKRRKLLIKWLLK